MNPKLLTLVQFNGPYHFNRTPIAPPETNVLVYVDPESCGSWGTHAIEGHYIGPALEHYRCYQVYIPSSSGNTQVFVLYHYNGNRIFMEAMKGKSKESMLAAYTKVYQCIQEAGLQVNLQFLDNECSQLISNFLKLQGVTKQLVQPHNHQANAAESTIQTAKNLIFGFCTTPSNLPLPI
jgi:hypothetical protein